jgi:chromate transporter
MKELFELVWTFMKIGAFTFGGGYAMLPMLQREIVSRHQWATMDEIMDYFAIGQCTPGIIAVNTATFVGYKQKGIAGGIFATLGLVLPSFIIISIIAVGLESFSHYAVVQHAFTGIRVAVGALILDAVIKLFKGNVKNIVSIVISALAFFLSVVLKTSPVWIVLAAALAGYLLFMPKEKATK